MNSGDVPRFRSTGETSFGFRRGKLSHHGTSQRAAFANPEKIKTPPIIMRKSHVTSEIHFADSVFIMQLYKCEKRIVDHIHIVGINSLADEGLPVMIFYLPGS